MAFDAKRLTPLDWGVIGAGGVAFISLFLPWWGASLGPISVTVSGWSTSYGWLGGLLLVAAGVWWFVVKAESGPRMSVSPIVLTLGASLVGLVIVLIRWITLPRASFGGHSYHYGGRAGIWIAVIAGVAQVACAAMLFRQSGEQLPWRQSTGGSTP